MACKRLAAANLGLNQARTSGKPGQDRIDKQNFQAKARQEAVKSQKKGS